MSDFLKRSLMPASADELLAWHARPGAFVRLMPPWQRVLVHRAARSLDNGDRAEFSICLGPLRRRWIAEHRALMDGIGFQDVQMSGPFARWEHSHRMIPNVADPGTSWLEDAIQYDVPGGAIGRLLVGGLLRRSLQRTFEYRHRVTAADLAAHRATNEQQGATPMNILVTGSTGLVGSQVVAFLSTGGHRVLRLVRGAARRDDEIAWNPNAGTIDATKLEGLDGVVHLAGENIASGRWNAARKARIRDSRVNGTRLLSETLAKLERKPRVLVSASAIGFYGDRGDEVLTENSAPGSSFLCDVCRQWEAATQPAKDAGIRVVNLRIGVVLTPRGGALAKMLTPFQLCVGGIVGNGKQFWSWIAIDDVVGAIHHALTHEELSGPVNAVAPDAMTNRDFTKILGKVLRRPTIAPLPAFVVKLLLGEMGQELLLASSRVVPNRLQQTGYQFRCPTLEVALRHVLGR
jgi:hypothetical protein